MGRRVLGARLSEAAMAGWANCAESLGVTLAALLEAIGLELADGRGGIDETTLARAQEIQRERKRRH